MKQDMGIDFKIGEPKRRKFLQKSVPFWTFVLYAFIVIIAMGLSVYGFLNQQIDAFILQRENNSLVNERNELQERILTIDKHLQSILKERDSLYTEVSFLIKENKNLQNSNRDLVEEIQKGKEIYRTTEEALLRSMREIDTLKNELVLLRDQNSELKLDNQRLSQNIRSAEIGDVSSTQPLTLEQISMLLETKIKESEIRKRIKDSKVNFELTYEITEQLRRLGASDKLLADIKNNQFK